MTPRYRYLLLGGIALVLVALGGAAAYHVYGSSARQAALAVRLEARLAADSAAAAAAQADTLRAAVALEGRTLHPGVSAFYAARAHTLAWSDPAARDALRRSLAASADDGLAPGRYHEAALTALARVVEPSDSARVEEEVLLTDAFLRLADDLHGPRVNVDSLYRVNWHAYRRPKDATRLLATALADSTPAPAIERAVDRLRPPHPGYRALRDVYVAMRARGASEDSLRTVALNLERWRWLPDSLGDLHVFVNLPAYELTLRENTGDGWSDVLRMPVVIGLPGWKTPVFSDTMTTVVFNPTWVMPPSIQREQYGRVRGFVEQAAGPRNPLGRVKFLFPNPHSVYLHDTNAKWAFGRERRAMSHGCVRLGHPDSLAAALLSRTNGWSADDALAFWRGPWRTRNVSLERPVPVHLVYFTAVPAPDGGVTFLDDVYGHDARLQRALDALDGAPEATVEA